MRYALGLTAVVVVGYLYTGLSEIRPGERGVVRRFGRVVATPGPGLWIGFPWGIERIDRVQVDQVKRLAVGFQPETENAGLDTPPGQLLTGDHNLVNLQVVLHYTVRDDQVVEYFLQSERAESLLSRAAESVLAEWVGGQSVDDVLIQSKARLPMVLAARLQQRLDEYTLGIEIQAASVSYLLPPVEVKDAFDAVSRAQAAILTREHKAREEAGNIRRRAEADAYAFRQRALAYSHERLQLARTEALGFEKELQQYQQLRSDKSDYLASLWWREMGKLFSRFKDAGRIEVLDHNLGGDDLDITIYLPHSKKK